MRLKLTCNLRNNEITKNYRDRIVSLFKRGLLETNNVKYAELYQTNKQKNYTFSVYFPNPVIYEDKIVMAAREVIINFSTGDTETGIVFYNAFAHLVNKPHPIDKDNELSIIGIQIVAEKKVIENKLILKTLSPICCKDHNRLTFKNWFYTWEDDSFLLILKRNMLPELEQLYGKRAEKDIADLRITPIAMKKVVVFCHDIHVASSVGTLEVEAPPYLLEHFLQYGLGSNRGSGFGFLSEQ